MAYLPDLPGGVAMGKRCEEVARRIREALDAYAEEMSALGQPLPAPGRQSSKGNGVAGRSAFEDPVTT